MKISKDIHDSLQVLGLGCSDEGCVWGHPGGIHTNGGCHCLIRLPVPIRTKLRKGITFLLATVTKLEKELEEAKGKDKSAEIWWL